MRRRPEEVRWSPDDIEQIKGVPWDRKSEKEDGDIVHPRGGVERMPEELQQEEKQAITSELNMPKSFHTKREDYERHGYTRGCPGCRALLTGTTRQKHTAQCRSRLEKELGGEERVKAAKRRREEFLEKVMVREDVKDGDSMKVEDDGAAKLLSSDSGECLNTLDGHDGKTSGDMNIDEQAKEAQPASGSGLSQEERKRGWQEAGWHELADHIKKKPVVERSVDEEKEGDMEIGELEVNVEKDTWEEWEDDGYEKDEFDPHLLREARLEELQFMEKIGVWEPSSWEECVQQTGRPPITTKWVDVDKGRDGEVLVRSRLVARDFKTKGDDRGFDVFAATPPLEMKRLLFRMARVKGSVGGDEKNGPVKLMFIDVKKAHLNGEVAEDEFAYILLPKEVGGGVGRLRRWLYGMRPAASAWEDHYAMRLKEVGFERGRAAPTAFVNTTTGVRVVVWGDDFTFLGRERHLKNIAEEMAQWYDIKVRAVMGPCRDDDKEVRILNRVVKWERDKITYEADDKHVVKIMDELGFDDSTKSLDTPLAKDHDNDDGDDEPLDDQEAKRYRRLAATVNYLATDRPDLQFTASVLGRTMARPTERSWGNLKKVARYLKGHVKVVYEFPEAEGKDVQDLVGYSDSDWAGCKRSRRSTSGGLVTLGGGVLRSWSNRQATVALSSGEAEFHSASKAAAEMLAVKSMMADLGWTANLKLHVDASVAQSMANRQGIGKIRHLEVRFLWLQDLAKQGAIVVRRVLGKFNPADVLTKVLSFSDMLGKLAAVHISPGIDFAVMPRGGVDRT